MTSQTKNFKFIYNPESFMYEGITYDEHAEHTTEIPPHFREGFITVWDTGLNLWTLVRREEFYNHAIISQAYEWNIDLKNKELKNEIKNLWNVLERYESEIQNIRKTLYNLEKSSVKNNRTLNFLDMYFKNQRTNGEVMVEVLDSKLATLELHRDFEELVKYLSKPWFIRMFYKIKFNYKGGCL